MPEEKKGPGSLRDAIYGIKGREKPEEKAEETTATETENAQVDNTITDIPNEGDERIGLYNIDRIEAEKEVEHTIKKYPPFIRKIRHIIHLPYTHVPECPACGSLMTGRFITMRKTYDYDWMIDDSLKRGEIIDFVTEVDPENRLFCLNPDCGYTWTQPVEERWLNLDEIEEEKRERCTREMLLFREQNGSEELRREKHKGIKGMINDTFMP